MAPKVSKFKKINVARQTGEIARFRVLGGPDHGSTYIITGSPVTVGRGEENDIILNDMKASRRHFEVAISNGVVSLSDIGSSHGVTVNGISHKKIQLKTGDKIGLGETVLEFILAEFGATQMFMRPTPTSQALGTGTSGLTQFITRSVGGSELVKSVGIADKSTGFVEKNKKLLIMIGALMAIATLLPEAEKKTRSKKNKYFDLKDTEGREPGGLMAPVSDEKAYKSAEMYFREGFREYRAKNYLRAQTAFETALQVYADHTLSRVYLETTKKAMEDDAGELIKNAKREEENRYGEALHRYEAVKRLYAKDQSNPLYKEAEDRIKDMEKKIKDLEQIR